jgi:NAD(P)H-hydrate epimerase
LSVVELFPPETLTGDALTARKMLEVSGCPVSREFKNEANLATIVIDAVLGTGLKGPVTEGPAFDAIQAINSRFPLAKIVAVDVPSGELVKADYTVTFTAPKPNQVLSTTYELMGRLVVVPIGTPDDLCQTNLNLTTAADLRPLFVPRPKNSNKGTFGHVVVVGGSFGKSGAPAMAALGALRIGAGLVTAAIPESVLPNVAAASPEIMTVPLGGDVLKGKTVLALGPGLGTEEGTVRFVKTLYEQVDLPAVTDADGLNALAGSLPHTDKFRVLTPHPGEMSRLTGKSTKEVQADRLGCAEQLAKESGAVIVLKGDRTVIAFPDGETWINPTGSPSMATGGTGDILTGMVAGLLGQYSKDHWKRAVVAAVWLHGRCGELAAEKLGEQSTLATDLLTFLPEAIDELRPAV